MNKVFKCPVCKKKEVVVLEDVWTTDKHHVEIVCINCKYGTTYFADKVTEKALLKR